ncbi:MAG: glycosyltransferase [Planctomycetaceae bacterium]
MPSETRLPLAVITPIPTPYRDPFWAEVARRPEIDLHVMYCAAGKSDRPWTLNLNGDTYRTVLPGTNLAARFGAGASCFWNPSILRRLKEGQFRGIIVGGYNHLTMIAAVAWARLRKVPFFLMNEVYLRQPRSRWRKIVKQPLVRNVIPFARGCFPTGTLASDYLRHYGANPECLCRLPNVPDVEGLYRQAQEFLPQRAELKRRLGLDAAPTVIFVSRLIELKRVDVLLDAFRDLLAQGAANLVIVGDGPMREAWEAHARNLKVDARVRFVGFVEPGDIPPWYAAADVFVLPSIDETWSVVALEALASGLPIVITDLVGCGPDVINDPRVGSIVPVGDSVALGAAIRGHLAADLPRSQIMELWEPIRREMTYAAIADRFVSQIVSWCGDGWAARRVG